MILFSEHFKTEKTHWGRAVILLSLCFFISSAAAAHPMKNVDTVLWSADTETGDLSQWTDNGGGGVFNTGTGQVTVTDKIARSGRYAVELSINIDHSDNHTNSQAARLFRWGENPAEAYYSAWFYFNDHYHPGIFWNIFQFKSKTKTGVVEPMWVLNVDHNPDGDMILYLWDALAEQTYEEQLPETPLPIPVREWVHIEVYYKRTTDQTGSIAVWQDGIQIFDINDVQTAIANNIQWSVNNYSNDIEPENPTIYIDDAMISTNRVGSTNSQ